MKVIVTGGGGFLGTYICKELLTKGHEVYSFSRNSYVHLTELGVICLKGDLTNYEDVKIAFKDMEAVFHVAALAGVWGDKKKYFNINTIGTQNAVNAARENKIKTFIYTSTPSVVFDFGDIENGDESIPYPKNYLTPYAYTKHLAEKYVLENCDEDFHAVALRPHLIWGPGDPHIIPRLVEKAKSGRLKQVGDGNNLVDVIYVKNAAVAHVQAFEKLIKDTSISSRAYFIGQERPVNLWQFINQLLLHSEVELIEDKISFKTAFFIGRLLEIVFKFLGIEKPEPPMTRFVACQLAKSHYFSHKRANEDFGYKPEISIEDGLNITFSNVKERKELAQIVPEL